MTDMDTLIERLRQFADLLSTVPGMPGLGLDTPYGLMRAAATALQQALADRNEARLQGAMQNFGLKMANEDCDKLEAQAAIDESEKLELLERLVAAEAQITRLTAAVSEETEACAKDREDAERWRALMSSPKMHWMGSAGFDHRPREGAMADSRALEDQDAIPRPGELWHFGMEFWFGMEPDALYPDQFERRVLVAYVDAIRSRKDKGGGLGEKAKVT